MAEKDSEKSRSENDGSIADLNLGAPDCSQRDGCRLNPSTLRSLHQPQRYLLWRVRSLQTRSFQHFIWQAMQNTVGFKPLKLADQTSANIGSHRIAES